MMCKRFPQSCALSGLWCSFYQTLNALFKQKRENKKSIDFVCFDSILIIFKTSEFLCFFNFIFDFLRYLTLAIVAIAALQYIPLKLNMIILKKDSLISTQSVTYQGRFFQKHNHYHHNHHTVHNTCPIRSSAFVSHTVFA